MEVAWACFQAGLRWHKADCIKVERKEERSSTRNLKENGQGRYENNRKGMDREQLKSLVSAFCAN